MRTYKNSYIRKCFASILFIVAANSVFADTDISDTPMAVKNNVAANFMFMMDTSGSMRHIVPDLPYSTTATYLSSCANNRQAAGAFTDLKAPSSTEYSIIIRDDGKTSFTNGSSTFTFGTGSGQVCFKPDLNTFYNFSLNADDDPTTRGCGTNGGTCKKPAGSSMAIYTGHFLNWYFGAATNYTSAASLNYSAGRKTGTKSRMEVAKAGAKTVINTIPLKTNTTAAKARLGLVTYNGSNGGKLVESIGDLDSNKLTTMKTRIDALEGGGDTPLSETLADIGHYFTINGNSASDPTLKMYPDLSSRVPANHNVNVSTLFKQGSTSPHKLNGVTSSTAAPIQYWCQKSYAVVMTDGRPTSDVGLSSNSKLCDYDKDMGGVCSNGGRKSSSVTTHIGPHLGGAHTYESNDGSDYLDDVAQALYDIDLRPDLQPTDPTRTKTKNNVRTYTIGFADEQAKNDPQLQEAANQGGGLFSTAGNEQELISAFSKMINDAFDQDGAAAAVAVVNTDVTVDNTSYASNYRSSYWTGDLRSYAIDTTTGEPNENYSWSAAAKLDALSDPVNQRKIVTFDGTTGVPFQPAYVTLQAANNTELVNYHRGQKTYEDNGDGVDDLFRQRSSLLGDIVNAEPVVVKYPENGNSYSPIVFQAANDGMLHAFCGKLSSSAKCGTGSNRFDAGKEIFAYVPKMVWPVLKSDSGNLANVNYVHKYSVDATPEVADVVSGTETYKLLVGGLGKGGKGYYALDVTEYFASNEVGYAAKAKWEFPASASSVVNSVGYTFGTPLIVKTSSGFRVLVASGYNNSDGSGKLFVLNPDTGAVTATINTGVGDATAPAGLAHIAKLNTAGPTDVIRYVYGGDLQGNVWRFDLNTNSSVKIATLRDGYGDVQPVSTAPVVANVPNSTNKYYVFVGTGKYLGDSDVPGDTTATASATQRQSMYAIIDDLSQTPAAVPHIRGTNGNICPSDGGDGDFICQSAGTADNNGNYTLTAHAVGSKAGWYFDLPYANGRVIGRPLVTDDYVLAFTINMPSVATCDPGGASAPVVLDAYNGGALLETYGGNTYRISIGAAVDGLASRFTQTDTPERRVGLCRRSNASTCAQEIWRRVRCTVNCDGDPTDPPSDPGPEFDDTWKKIYWRELN